MRILKVDFKKGTQIIMISMMTLILKIKKIYINYYICAIIEIITICVPVLFEYKKSIPIKSGCLGERSTIEDIIFTGKLFPEI